MSYTVFFDDEYLNIYIVNGTILLYIDNFYISYMVYIILIIIFNRYIIGCDKIPVLSINKIMFYHGYGIILLYIIVQLVS